MFDRRRFLSTAAGAAFLGSCGRVGRGAGDVVAAGNPAALLIYALAPQRLAGWPKRPGREALALLGEHANLPELGALNAQGANANPEAVAALGPRLILDYGDDGLFYREVARRVEQDVRAPYRLLRGDLPLTADAVRQAGALLGVDAAPLADAAARTIAAWRKASSGARPRFYYARDPDGLETGFAGSLATEVLEGAGWRNVATGDRPTIARVTREQLFAWDPDVLVTLDPAFAKAARSDPFWARTRGGAKRPILLLPALPFGWVDRPPSLNRLLGCAWLAGNKDAVAQLYPLLYHRPLPNRAELMPQWQN